jgi:hypothetical protein
MTLWSLPQGLGAHFPLLQIPHSEEDSSGKEDLSFLPLVPESNGSLLCLDSLDRYRQMPQHRGILVWHRLPDSRFTMQRPDTEDTGGCDMGAYERQSD